MRYLLIVLFALSSLTLVACEGTGKKSATNSGLSGEMRVISFESFDDSVSFLYNAKDPANPCATDLEHGMLPKAAVTVIGQDGQCPSGVAITKISVSSGN